MKIYQVVPFALGSFHGINDYALAIAKKLRKDYLIDSHFIVPTNNSLNDLKTEEFDGFKFTFCSDFRCSQVSNLLRESCALVLHFDRYACRLVRNISFQSNLTKIKILTVVHEANFNSALSRKVKDFAKWLIPTYPLDTVFALREISKTSHKIYLATSLHKKRIPDKYNSKTNLSLCFSNIGEPAIQIQLELRPKNLIVFGSAGTRRKIYKNNKAELLKSCYELNIQQVYDVGPLEDKMGEISIPDLDSISLTCTGSLPKEEVSKLFLSARAGFFNNCNRQPGTLGKSGVFAAYASHGLLPVGAAYDPSEADGLFSGKHYLVTQELSNTSLSSLNQIAINAYQWYSGHKLGYIVKKIAEDFHQLTR